MAGDWDQQPGWKKALRWLRYKPPAFVAAAVATIGWVFTLCPPVFINRRKTLACIWFSNVKSLAEVRMGRWHTTQEVIDELRLRGRISVVPTCETLTDKLWVSMHDIDLVLAEKRRDSDYVHGHVTAGGFELTPKQAEWLAEDLLKAVRKSKQWERDIANMK